MPTLARFGSLAIQMYFDDHAPPHFHIVGPDVDVAVSIMTLQVIAGRVRRAQIASALRWAEVHRDELVAQWAEVNGQKPR